MILTMGYWVLGDICRYWTVLLFGAIFSIATPNTILIRQQSAEYTWYPSWRLWCGRCQQGEWEGVECKLYIIIIIIQSWDLRGIMLYIFRFRSIHC